MGRRKGGREGINVWSKSRSMFLLVLPRSISSRSNDRCQYRLQLRLDAFQGLLPGMIFRVLLTVVQRHATLVHEDPKLKVFDQAILLPNRWTHLHMSTVFKMAHGAPRRDGPSLAPYAMAQKGARHEEHICYVLVCRVLEKKSKKHLCNDCFT